MDRRTKEGYKLRIYIDAIKEVKSMTDEEWINQWITARSDDPYLSRLEWISYLEKCALIEADKYLRKSEAA